MSNEFDSERPTGQPATLDQPLPAADGAAPAEAHMTAHVTLDAAPDPLPAWFLMLMRDDAPLMRFGH